jgi:hypothetical protein
MKSAWNLLQRLENAQNGNERLLQKVGMDLGSAPHPLGAGARLSLDGAYAFSSAGKPGARRSVSSASSMSLTTWVDHAPPP